MSKQSTLFGKAAVKKPFFTQSEASNSIYFRTVNALWQLYPGADRQTNFSDAQCQWREKYKAMPERSLPCLSVSRIALELPVDSLRVHFSLALQNPVSRCLVQLVGRTKQMLAWSKQ